MIKESVVDSCPSITLKIPVTSMEFVYLQDCGSSRLNLRMIQKNSL